MQSALDPRGPAASSIAGLSWAMFAGGTAILLLVAVILLYVLLSRPERRRRIDSNAFIVLGGIALPVVTLSILLVFVFRIGADLTAEPEDPLVVEVTGHQWWWSFRYVGDRPQQDAVTANELHIPVGRPVKLRLKSADVIHSFWVPNLAGKRDMIPGMTNHLTVQADRPGLHRGECNEFCGAQHALMNLYVIAQPEGEFRRWLQAQRRPAREPEEELARTGREVFLSSGCAVCHSVRGTGAGGNTGPDLTHFGSRRSIAAGTLANTDGNRQAWIADAQHFKPGNKMPDFPLGGRESRALAAYLGSLE